MNRRTTSLTLYMIFTNVNRSKETIEMLSILTDKEWSAIHLYESED